MFEKVKLCLNWFFPANDPEIPEVPEAPDVPDIPGVGGVLAVYCEIVDDAKVLRATWKEIKNALDKGWVVLLVDRETEDSTVCEMVASAIESDGFIVTSAGGNSYTTDSADGQPTLASGDDGSMS